MSEREETDVEASNGNVAAATAISEQPPARDEPNSKIKKASRTPQILVRDWRTVGRKFAQAVVLFCLILAIWALFVVTPAVFYALPSLNLEGKMSQQMVTVTSGEECSPLTNYSGSVCLNELQTWQRCFSPCQPNSRGNTQAAAYIPSNIDQAEMERTAQLILKLGPNLFGQLSPDCEAAFRPFVCLHLFGSCDSEGQLHQVTREECVRVRDDVCVEEWRHLMGTDMLSQLSRRFLPQCDELQDVMDTCNVTSGEATSPTQITQQPQINQSFPECNDNNTNTTSNQCSPTHECSPGFILTEGGICRAVCGEWTLPLDQSRVLFRNLVIIISAAIALVSSLLAPVVVFALTAKKEVTPVWKYPTVYLSYIYVTEIILEILVLIGFTDNAALFCESTVPLQLLGEGSALGEGTPFCKLSGFFLYYCSLQLALWGLFYPTTVFLSIKFPFHYRRLKKEKKLKYIHITSVVIAIVLPLIPGLVHLKDGYMPFLFPSVLCIGRNSDHTFFTFILPLGIITATSASMYILLFWIVLKEQIIKKKKYSGSAQGSNRARVSILQTKILIITCYIIIISAIVLTLLTFWESASDDFIRIIEDYFLCEGMGQQEGRNCSALVDPLRPLEDLFLATLVLLGFLPLIYFIITVNTKRCTQGRNSTPT